jgi:hypothetical protein
MLRSESIKRGLVMLTLSLVFISCREQRTATGSGDHAPVADAEVPRATSTHEVTLPAPSTAAAGSLAATILDPDQFDDPFVRRAYASAKEVPDRLNQLYCYCHCKENEMLKHKSLLTCFQTDHAATCQICMREAIQAWNDSKKGLDIEATRKAIDMIYGDGGASPHPHAM